jgi:hypothetical protein
MSDAGSNAASDEPEQELDLSVVRVPRVSRRHVS